MLGPHGQCSGDLPPDCAFSLKRIGDRQGPFTKGMLFLTDLKTRVGIDVVAVSTPGWAQASMHMRRFSSLRCKPGKDQAQMRPSEQKQDRHSLPANASGESI